MALQEKVVDPQLDNFLNKELEVNKTRENLPAGEEFEEQSSPLSESTKKSLLYYLHKAHPEKDVKEILDIIDRISAIDEQQARRYLEALRYTSTLSVDSKGVKMILKRICNLFMNPSDYKYKKLCKNDKYINECLSDFLNDFLPYAGKAAGILFFALYTFESWKPMDNSFITNETTTDRGSKRKQEEKEGRKNKKAKHETTTDTPQPESYPPDYDASSV